MTRKQEYMHDQHIVLWANPNKMTTRSSLHKELDNYVFRILISVDLFCYATWHEDVYFVNDIAVTEKNSWCQ